MYNEKISIIVTNYNHAKYIQQAVLSAEKQTYENKEIIIIDDASTDDSETHLRDFENRGHKVIRLKTNKGKWFALNTAIEQATGQLITLQDADDSSSIQRIERQYIVLKENNSFHNLCGFTHCYSQNDIDEAEKIYFANPPTEIIKHEEVTKLVYNGWKTPNINHYFLGNYEAHGASCLFYKQFWNFGMKFLPGNLGLRCQKAEDSDFNTKMTLLLQKTSILKEPLYCYRRGTSTNQAWLENL